MAWGSPRCAMKSTPFTPTSPNARVTTRASSVAPANRRSSPGNCASPAGARMFPQYRNPSAPKRASPARMRGNPSATAPPPVPHVPAARAQRLDHPTAALPSRRAREANARARDTGVAEDPRETAGIARPGDHDGCVPPQGPIGGERAYGAGVVVEARLVDRRVTTYVPHGGCGGPRAEAAVHANHANLGRTRPEIEISEAVYRDDIVARPRRGLRESASRHPGEEHACHESPSRRRACSRGIT